MAFSLPVVTNIEPTPTQPVQTPQQASIAATIQTLRLTVNDDGSTTMTSLELVAFINTLRGPDEQLRHDNFMAKVPTVLKTDAPKFLGTQNYGNNNTRAIYVFPRKPALRRAMSYSYELQEAVLDAWTEAERALQVVAIVG